jgi:hypothetical protein
VNLLFLCDPDFIAYACFTGFDCAHWQFNHASSLGQMLCNAKGSQAFHQVNDLVMLIEKYYIDREPHPKGVNALARNNP